MINLDDAEKIRKSELESYCRKKLIDPSGDSGVQEAPPCPKCLDNDNLKIIHGTMEIANQMYTMVQGLKKLGAEAKTLSYYQGYLQYKSDMSLDIYSYISEKEANREIKHLAAQIIPEYDVFHYHFGTSLTLDNSDLPLLRELNKKVLMHHWGSDVRIYSEAVQRNPYVRVKIEDENWLKRKLERLSGLIDTCIVGDYELYEYVKDYYSQVVMIPQVIDIDGFDIPERKTSEKKITIVHAPTSPRIKGTKYILQTIEELENEYDFDFILVKNMAYEEAKKVYLNADIVIDQMLIGSYGLVAIENMALGKPVICWISDFMKEKYPGELPIISANPDNIKAILEGVLRNKDCLEEIGKKSRKYVETYHDVNKYSQKLLDLYKALPSQK
ncbi:MAG: glycosyltransferase family 1 protein [Peptococcaceae bacterium]